MVSFLQNRSINESYSGDYGLGSQFLHLCEQWLRTRGIKSLHEEARPNAVKLSQKWLQRNAI